MYDVYHGTYVIVTSFPWLLTPLPSLWCVFSVQCEICFCPLAVRAGGTVRVRVGKNPKACAFVLFPMTRNTQTVLKYAKVYCWLFLCGNVRVK